MPASDPIETYVIRTVCVDAIEASEDNVIVLPDRDQRRAAMRFDGPMVAAEVLLGPPGENGRHRVLAGGERLGRARGAGRHVVLAAVVGSDTFCRQVLARWCVHHAA
jgi:hypothetical protein